MIKSHAVISGDTLHYSQTNRLSLLTALDRTGQHRAHTRPEMTNYFASTTVKSRIKA